MTKPLTVTGIVSADSTVVVAWGAAIPALSSVYVTVAAGCVTMTVVVETIPYSGSATSDVLPPIMTLYVVRFCAMARAGSAAKAKRGEVNIIAQNLRGSESTER